MHSSFILSDHTGRVSPKLSFPTPPVTPRLKRDVVGTTSSIPSVREIISLPAPAVPSSLSILILHYTSKGLRNLEATRTCDTY